MQEAGHTFIVNGYPCTYYGSLGLVSADNPASCAMGGFKESSSAYRHCRHCLGTKTEIKIEVYYIYTLCSVPRGIFLITYIAIPCTTMYLGDCQQNMVLISEVVF